MDTPSTYSVIPEKEIRCVWMDAGIVGFKLCDQIFECDTCEFNAIIKQHKHESSQALSTPSIGKDSTTTNRNMSAEEIFTTAIKKRFAPLYAHEFTDNRMYYKGHFWIKRIDGGKSKFGIDHVAANLFHPVLSIVFPKAPFVIHRNDPFCWIILTGGVVTLRSPIDGTILHYNAKLQHQPGLLNTDPYGEGLIMELSSHIKMPGFGKITSAIDAQNLVEQQVSHIEYSLLQALRHNISDVGTTLFDGGIGLENVERILGPQLYVTVVNQVMNSAS